jgi:hypothetical protein
MLREIPVKSEGKKSSIGLTPDMIVFIEQTGKTCNIVIKVTGKELTYPCLKSFKYMMNFVNLSQYGLFFEN